MSSMSDTACANGSKWKGSVTLEGKAKSSQNAMKDRLLGGPIVLPHESQQDIAIVEALAFAELAENSKRLRLVERYSRSLRRSYEKASQEHERLQLERTEQNEPEPQIEYSSLISDPRLQDSGFMDAVAPCLDLHNQLVPKLEKRHEQIR